jgi:enamine deaminase RidA (YjgF/YER057c/UK114 family)
LSDWASSGGVIHSGLDKENVVKVTASGTHFVFFANGKQIGQINDTAFTSGDIGLTSGQNNEVVYTDLVIDQIGG